MMSVSYAESHIQALYSECHSAECHYAVCHYAACHYAACHYADCHYAESHYAEYHSANCHYAKCHFDVCHYAECNYTECCDAECRGALPLPSHDIYNNFLSDIFALKEFFYNNRKFFLRRFMNYFPGTGKTNI